MACLRGLARVHQASCCACGRARVPLVCGLRTSPDVPLPSEVPADACVSLPGVPAGVARLTDRRLHQDPTLLLKGVGHASCRTEDPLNTSHLQQTPHVHVAFAVPWNVAEFLEQALRAEHPCVKLSGCETPAMDNIRWITSTSATEARPS